MLLAVIALAGTMIFRSVFIMPKLNEYEKKVNNQTAKSELGKLLSKELLEQHLIIAHLNESSTNLDIDHVEKKILSSFNRIHKIIDVLQNGGYHKYSIKNNLESLDSSDVEIFYKKPINEGIVIELININPKLITIEETITEMLDEIRKAYYEKDDENKNTIFKNVDNIEKRIHTQFVRADEEINNIFYDVKMKLSEIKEESIVYDKLTRTGMKSLKVILILIIIAISSIAISQIGKIVEDRKKIIKELSIAKEKAEVANISKSRFLSNMSNDLRTHLNVILLLTCIFVKNKLKNLNEKQVKNAELIYSQGDVLLELINDILDLSKIEAKKMKLVMSKIETDTMKLYFEDQFSLMTKSKGLELEVNFNDDIPKYLYSDISKINQIAKNFVSNAIKFTPTGKVIISLRNLTLEDKVDNYQNKLLLSVKDTGIGIKEEQKEKIFTPFEQASGSTSKKYGGTGLGLSISKELAYIIGGEIKLYSKYDEGSEFCLIFPINKNKKVKQISEVSLEFEESIIEGTSRN